MHIGTKTARLSDSVVRRVACISDRRIDGRGIISARIDHARVNCARITSIADAGITQDLRRTTGSRSAPVDDTRRQARAHKREAKTHANVAEAWHARDCSIKTQPILYSRWCGNRLLNVDESANNSSSAESEGAAGHRIVHPAIRSGVIQTLRPRNISASVSP